MENKKITYYAVGTFHKWWIPTGKGEPNYQETAQGNEFYHSTYDGALKHLNDLLASRAESEEWKQGFTPGKNYLKSYRLGSDFDYHMAYIKKIEVKLLD